MANRSFNYVEIPAADGKVMGDFYNKLFEWPMTHMPDPVNYTTFQAGEMRGGFPNLGEMYKPGDILVYVSSDDIDADLRKIESLGGKTVVPKSEIPPFGTYAIFADPTGNRIGLFKATPQSA